MLLICTQSCLLVSHICKICWHNHCLKCKPLLKQRKKMDYTKRYPQITLFSLILFNSSVQLFPHKFVFIIEQIPQEIMQKLPCRKKEKNLSLGGFSLLINIFYNNNFMVDRLKSFFSSTEDKNKQYSSLGQNDEENSGLIQSATQGVFSKGSEMMETLDNTGSDMRIAVFFLFFSVMFFFFALTSLPFILFSPKTFFLYFIYGIVFLQCALAFYWGPGTYLKKACSWVDGYLSGVLASIQAYFLQKLLFRN